MSALPLPDQARSAGTFVVYGLRLLFCKFADFYSRPWYRPAEFRAK